MDGWISGSPIVFPRLTVQIFDLVQDGQLEAARALWARLTEFVRLEFGPFPAEVPSANIIAVIKAALNALGDEVGDPLPPIQPLRGAELAHVQQVARSLAQFEAAMCAVQGAIVI